MTTHYESVIRKLRISEDGRPVLGVRLVIRCGCGFSYPQTFVVGVSHPITHCLRCYKRNRLRLSWNLSEPAREGQRIRLTLTRT